MPYRPQDVGGGKGMRPVEKSAGYCIRRTDTDSDFSSTRHHPSESASRTLLREPYPLAFFCLNKREDQFSSVRGPMAFSMAASGNYSSRRIGVHRFSP